MDELRRLPIQFPKMCVGLVFVVGVVGTIILSFSSLEYTQIGLNYDAITMTVEKKGYTGGRYFLGLGHSFIRYPSTVQTIQFTHERASSGPPLNSRTSDGLQLSLEISFQYQFNVSIVYDLYEKFGTTFEPVFVNMAVDHITTLATSYSATDFFSFRNKIGNDMENSLRDHFATNAFSSVPFFQLRSVELPKEFEDAIQDTEVAKQDIQTAGAEKEVQQVQMKTQVLQAMQQTQAIGLQANATGQSILLNMQAYVTQFNLAQKLQAESFKPLFEKFKGNETLLLQYMQNRALRDHPDHLSVVNIA